MACIQTCTGPITIDAKSVVKIFPEGERIFDEASHVCRSSGQGGCLGPLGNRSDEDRLPALTILYLPEKRGKSRALRLRFVRKACGEYEIVQSSPFRASGASGHAPVSQKVRFRERHQPIRQQRRQRTPRPRHFRRVLHPGRVRVSLHGLPVRGVFLRRLRPRARLVVGEQWPR